MHPDLCFVADCVAYANEEIVVVGGQRKSVPRDLPLQSRRDRLAEILYSELYIRPGPRAHKAKSLIEVNDFQADLLRANHSHHVWQPSWTIESVQPNGTVAVRRREIIFHVDIREVQASTGIKSGAQCSVLVPSCHLGMVPGFVLALGEHDLCRTRPMCRSRASTGISHRQSQAISFARLRKCSANAVCPSRQRWSTIQITTCAQTPV